MFHSAIKKHGNIWKERGFLRSVLIGLFVVGIGLAASALAREHLEHAVHAQGGPDLLLDLLPAMELKDFLAWGAELLLWLLALLLFLYPEYIPFSLKTVGMLYLIRAFFVILTPLGPRSDQVIVTTKGIFYTLAYSSNDFFFSGHVAFPFILALIFWQKHLIRYLAFVIAAVFAIAVLLAHTHYSIDVFAVPFIVPTIFGLCRYLFARDVRYTHVNYTEAHADHIPPLL